MRKLSKVICIALSLMMLVNLTGFEAAASEPGVENQADGENENATVSPDPADQENNDDKQGSGDVTDVKDDADNSDTAKPDDNDDQSGETDTDAGNTGDVMGAQGSGQEDDADEVGDELDKQGNNDITAEPEGTDKLKITWAKQGEVSEYKVIARPDSGVEIIQDVTDELSAELSVVRGVKYVIEVQYTNEQGQIQKIGPIPAILLEAPANLTATPANGTVKLTWTAVSEAQSYVITYGNGLEKTTTTASCDIIGLTNGQNYSFSVKAYVKYPGIGSDSKEYEYKSVDASVSSTPLGNKPAQVTGFSGIDGEKSAILTWSKATYATSYAVDRYNASKKEWETVKTGITQLTYTDSKLTAGKSYKYRVAGVNENGAGTYSSTVTISVKKTPGTTVRSIGYKATVKSRAPLFATKSSSKKLKYLKAGTNVTTIDYGSGRYKIKIGGKNYWISKDRLKFKSSIWTTKDYSTKVKEDFVNKKGYKSSSKYLIWISQYTQRVIIYQGSKGKWKMIRNCRCATGTHLHMTPKGKFKVGKKEKGWFYKKTFEKPIVHFKGQNSFHSRIKNYKGGYADATIGRPRSKGCVRLYDEDINFIYKKCPKGTTVISL